MTITELKDKVRKIIAYLIILEQYETTKYDDKLTIQQMIRHYKKLYEVAETNTTFLSDYSVGYNYAAYLKCPLGTKEFEEKYPNIKSLKQYAEKFTLDDIEDVEPITMYINDKYTTIDIFNKKINYGE